MTGPTARIRVGAERGYDVHVGRDLAPELPELLAALLSTAATVAVVHTPPVADTAARVAAALRATGRTAPLLTVPDGEAGKDLSAAAALWDTLGEIALSRSDALVAVGGGATTDLVGFVAATWLRGVAVVHVPTTLLGMVDAAVGGKTAINTAAGKNLVGAFHQPAGVICDLAVLSGLPRPDYVSGLAEVIKVGFTSDPVILDLVEADPVAATDPGGPHTGELVSRAIRVKAAVVGADPLERAGREVLNYGHTLGHAVERVADYRIRHGEAVAIGLVYAATLARRAGRLDPAIAARHGSVLSAVGLPTRYRPDCWPRLRAAMRVDKKNRSGRLRFIVLDGLARPGHLDDPDPELLAGTYEEVSR